MHAYIIPGRGWEEQGRAAAEARGGLHTYVKTNTHVHTYWPIYACIYTHFQVEAEKSKAELQQKLEEDSIKTEAKEKAHAEESKVAQAAEEQEDAKKDGVVNMNIKVCVCVCMKEGWRCEYEY